jgi:AcrR family transcriptional regulator
VARPAGTTAEDTRARILAVALELISERGFAGTSIRDLAERLDLTTAAMYYHFSSKDALLDALVAPLIDGVAALSARASSGELGEVGLLREVVTVLSGEGAKVMGVLHGDPSATHRVKTRCDPDRMFADIVRGLARSDDSVALLRASCAVGAIQGAVFAAAHNHPGRRGSWPGFDDEQRTVVVTAALAALHSSGHEFAVPVMDTDAVDPTHGNFRAPPAVPDSE